MTLAGEVRYSFRSLINSPVFAIVAVLSLSLGIGANTAVFSMLDQALLRFLPVQDPGRLVQLKEVGNHYGSNTGFNSLSYPIYRDFAEQNRVFSGMLCQSEQAFSIEFGGRSERANGELISGTYFPVLGLKPVVGRLFTAEEDRTRGGAPFAVLSYGYWQSRFAGDPAVIGKQIVVNNHPLTIVGVAPRGFDGLERLIASQIYMPIMMAEQLTQETRPFDNRRRRWLHVFGRLNPGVTPEQAKASLEPIFHRILEMEVQQKEFAKASPYTRAQFLKMTLNILPGGGGQSDVAPFIKTPLFALMGMVALVLLIACANVANLVIARSAARRKEIAVRLAIGGSRLRIIRQLLIESLMLALAGGAVGIAIGFWTLRFLAGVMPKTDPPIQLSALPDPRMLGFALALSFLTVGLFGLLPALQATRADVAPTLKEQTGGIIGGGQAGWRKALVCVQVSLSLLLLIGAGLFVGTLRNLKAVSPGFEVNHLLSFSVDPTLSGYDNDRAKLFYQQLKQQLDAVPGVRSSSVAVVKLLSFDEWDSTVSVEGYVAKPGEEINPWLNYVSPDFFRTMQIPLYAGRDFTDRDKLDAPKVAIVNEKFARRYFGTSSPIGRHIGMGGDPGTKIDIEIIGVVRDTKYITVHAEAPRQVFFPYLQNKWAAGMTAYVRTENGLNDMLPLMRSAVHKLDANLPVFDMKTEQRQLEDSLALERLSASLATAFGIIATLLAAIGLYGVMAFLVARRTREIGIRMALGALQTDVLWIVMREVLLLAAIGLAVGLPVALLATRLLASQLYGMSPSDPLIVALAVVGLTAVAAFSGYLPALRATRIHPLTALRYE